MKKSTAVDSYINEFPKEVQQILQQVRETIQEAAPKAEETISYGIPTFTLDGNLVHFGGFKNHIGFYPTPAALIAFKNELSIYEGAKGSVKFPFDKLIPYDLITKIVTFRIKQMEEKKTTALKRK